MTLALKDSPRLSTQAKAARRSINASTANVINILAYVHLRNIHASTGAGRVARQLTEHLALRDDIALRILADQRDHDRILPLVGEPWQSFRYSTFASDTSRQQARWFVLDSPKAETFWPEADIVFCAGESYVPTTKARLVVTAHDAAYFEQGAHQRGNALWKQRLKWKLLYRKLAKRVDLIHTVSQFSAERLAHFFPALSPRIRVVPNAVTPLFFSNVSSFGKQYLASQNLKNRPYVLVPGGLNFRKNADLVLAAAPELLTQHPNLTLVVSGHSDPAYVAQAKRLGSRIQLLGFVQDEQLQAIYASAQAVWFPSLYEGFGLPVLEAMASGTPVVASNSSALPEIAGGAAILAAPTSPQEHLDALDTLINDQVLSERMRQQGYARAAQFTWAKSAAALKQCFEEVL